MIWIGAGIAVAGYFIGRGLTELARAISEGSKVLATAEFE